MVVQGLLFEVWRFHVLVEEAEAVAFWQLFWFLGEMSWEL